MYIENAEKFLKNLGFEKFKVEYFLKINEELQLYAVSTDVNDIMLVSEHQIIELNRSSKFEDNNENTRILSEVYSEDDIMNIFKKYNLIAD